jgi:tetratricopeptide (TPR) repeat protein
LNRTAIREFSLILASKPNNNIARLYLATTWKEKGDTKKALEEFLKVDPKSEEYLTALKQITFIHIKSGSLDEGIEFIRRNIPDSKEKKELYILLSLLYEEKMDYVKAIEMLEEIRKIEPKNVEMLFQIGMLHEKKGESEKALIMIEDILKIEPDYPNALNFVGYSWAEKGIKLDEAEIMIKKALLKKPDDGAIIDSLGWVYYKKGNYQLALQELLRANQLVPDDPTIAEHIGDIYVSLKEYSKALPYYEKSIQLEKDVKKKKIVEDKLKAIKEPKK